MNNLSSTELLNYAVANGMINIDTIRENIEMNERKKYLEMHKSKIWQSTDSKWYTFVPDSTKKNGRRLVKRNTEIEIEKFLVDFYKGNDKPITFDKVFYEWIDRKLKFDEISRQTSDRYKDDFKKYFCDCKEKDIKYVNSDWMDEFILDCIKKYNMKSKAWSNLRTVIKGFFLYAKKKGYTNFDIISYLQELELSRKLFNHEKKDDKNVIFKKEEIKRLVDELSNSKNIKDLAILFAVYTGMRVGEIVALKWEDIHENYIYVNRTQINYKDDRRKNVHEIRDFPKTEAGIRNVAIVPELRIVINRLKCINPFTEYVFEKNGECIHKHLIINRLYALCERFGFPKKGMHAIRKYYATTLINAGVEEIIIISQMGHTDFETTKRYYYKDNNSMEYVTNKISHAIVI